MINFVKFTGIGENLRSDYEQAVEEDKQKAIRCTEEVVRREESVRRECELDKAKAEWKKERQQLFHEAHQSQLRAIARQNALLEQKLRKEFAETMIEMQAQHKEHVEEVTRQTWAEAEVVKQRAIEDTRTEEKELAREEARMVAERVAEEKTREAEQAAMEKAKALDDQNRHLGQLHNEALDEQKRKLELKSETKLGEVTEEYEVKLLELQTRLEEQVEVSQSLERDLAHMTISRNEWEEKYKAMKQEFSNFIDQFPGFRGEFVLD